MDFQGDGMKEESFINAKEGWDFKDDVEVKKVALPSELPVQLDTSSLPATVLRSRAVEALIQQNDDLMSRLSLLL